MLETLKVRPVTQADKEYSALVSIPVPLNVTLIVFAPILLTSKDPERVNKWILYFAYFPTLLFTTSLFLAYNIVLLPLAYVKLFFHKLVMIFVYSKSYRVSRADKFMNVIVFLLIGAIRLILNVISDQIVFI